MADWARDIRERLARLRLRPEREVEIVEELSQHLDDQVRDLVAGGIAPDEARQQALADLDANGMLARRLDETEAPRLVTLPPGTPARGPWLSQLWQDIRYAVRGMRRRPWFAISVVATMALTVGPVTAIVSVGNWLLWTPSRAVAEPDRLVMVWTGQWRDAGGVSPRSLSYLNLADVREAARTLAGISGWQETSLSLTAPGQKPRTSQGGFVSAHFFDVMGIRLAAGRTFLLEEDRPPFGAPVGILSHAFARQAFGSPELALEQTVHVNGRPMTVVGVAPAGFLGVRPTSVVDIWYPGAAYAYVNHYSEQNANRFTGRSNGLFYMFIGRLAPGVDPGAAQAELDVLIPRLADQYPEDNAAFRRAAAKVFPGLGPDELARPRLARLINGLLIVAGALLLLGCTNISNLLLSQAVRARAETAIRLALGASRGRLIRQVITESVVLCVAGAALGVVLAIWLKRALQLWMLPGIELLPLSPTAPLDRVVLSIALAVAVGCGLAVGIAPAWLGTRAALGRGLAVESGRSGTRGHRVRTILAAVQLALSLALIAGAVLLVLTLRHLSSVNLGFEANDVVTQWLSLRSHGYSADRARAFSADLVARLREDRRFESVSLATGYPFGYSRIERIQRPGGTERDTVDVRTVATDDRFPHVLGLQLLSGRYLRPDEVLKAAPQSGDSVIVSESLARALFDRTNVVGSRLTVPRTLGDAARDFVIVGVMRDTRTGSLIQVGDPLIYHALTEEDFVFQTALVVRSPLPLATVSSAIDAHAVQLDRTLALGPARSLRQSVDRTVANIRAFANVLLVLAAVGVVLAGVGLCGLLAQAVGERRREFGIRLAIGASSRNIAVLVARQAGWISLVGIVAGLALAYWGTALVKSYLAGVSEQDVRVYALTIAFLLSVVAIATAWPAWSATRVNPIETLKAE